MALLGCSAESTLTVAPPVSADLSLLFVFEGANFLTALGPISEDESIYVSIEEGQTLYLANYTSASLTRIAPRIDLDRLDEVTVNAVEEHCPAAARVTSSPLPHRATATSSSTTPPRRDL